MISAKKAYADWAKIYDSNNNRTRDLERVVGQTILGSFKFKNILEIGCGTGKNTEWLLEKTERLTSVDFSKEMLEEAKKKIKSPKVAFKEGDVREARIFSEGKPDLITFSLVLEHIKDLKPIFKQAAQCLAPGGKIYLCEWHPYKHLAGGTARFESKEGTVLVESYVHHISEFTDLAFENNLKIDHLGEWFDDDGGQLPRLISLILSKET